MARTRAGKIEQFNLGPRIVAGLDAGQTSRQIASALRSDGFNISQPVVARWIKEQREKNLSRAEQVFSEHVDRELPKDLAALEEMERLCLSWSGEEPAAKAQRISAWTRVADSLDDFVELVTGVPHQDEKGRRQVVERIYKMVLQWIISDINSQKQRLSAMKMATGIIEVKLRNAGLLGDNEKGRIIIKPYDGSKPAEDAPASASKDQRRLFVVPGSGG
jgi:hypothetical protein